MAKQFALAVFYNATMMIAVLLLHKLLELTNSNWLLIIAFVLIPFCALFASKLQKGWLVLMSLLLNGFMNFAAGMYYSCFWLGDCL